MKIEIEKLNKTTHEERHLDSWPIWEKEVSRFDWYYDAAEECYLLAKAMRAMGLVWIEHQARI